MTPRRACLIALLGLTLLSQAKAQQPGNAPLLLPTRDVVVIYHIDGGAAEVNGAQKVQATYTKAGARTRIDFFRWAEAKYAFLAFIDDEPANRFTAILPERRTVIERAIGDILNPVAFLDSKMRFVRGGQATVADTPCTVWNVRISEKNAAFTTACVTDDGVVLRITSDDDAHLRLTAT